jgi:hypothetical protein
MSSANICTATYTCDAVPADVNLCGMFTGSHKLACEAAYTDPLTYADRIPRGSYFLSVSRLNIASIEMCFHTAGTLYCVGVPMSGFP